MSSIGRRFTAYRATYPLLLCRLSLLGYRVGQRLLPLLSHRIEFPVAPSLSSSSSTYNRTPKREVRLLAVLLWIHTQLWKALFGRAADSLERSTEKSDECACMHGLRRPLVSCSRTLLPADMISTNTPLLAKSMTVPREMNQLSVEAFTAGIVEAALDGLGFVSASLSPLSALLTEYFAAGPRDGTQCPICRTPAANDDPGQAEQGSHGPRGSSRPSIEPTTLYL